MKSLNNNKNIVFYLTLFLFTITSTYLSAQVDVDENSDVWIGGNVSSPNPDNPALNVYGKIGMRYPGPYFNNIVIGGSNGNAGMNKGNNILIGANSGNQMVAAKGNIIMGNTVASSLVNGSSNICIGAFTGNQLQNALYNSFIGNFSGNNFNSNYNVVIGHGAGTATDNSSPTCTGINNVFIGRDAGSYVQGSARGNTGIGTFALNSVHSGVDNLAFGYQSLGHVENGSSNVGLGAYAGDYNKGNRNVFIGNRAGATDAANPTNFNDRLYIHSSSVATTTPLIYGEFNTGLVRVNGKLETTGNITTSGNVIASCGTLSCSDVRYKKNFQPLQNVQEKLNQINAVYYNWRQAEFPDMRFDDKTYLGFKAQEVEQQFPELVHTDEKGYKSVDYARMSVVLLEAVKTLQKDNESIKQENKALRNAFAQLESKVDQLIESDTSSSELSEEK